LLLTAHRANKLKENPVGGRPGHTERLRLEIRIRKEGYMFKNIKIDAKLMGGFSLAVLIMVIVAASR
jgi:hypothetical protein